MLKRGILHILKSWKHHASLQLLTVLVLVSCFTVIAGVLTITNNLYRVLTLWGESMQVSVYLNEDLTQPQLQSIQNFLKNSEKIEKLSFVSKEAAYKQFSEQLASFAPSLLKDKELLKYIPASFQFSLDSKIPPQNHLSEMEKIANEVRALAGVEEVSFGQEWVKSFSRILQNVNWLGRFLSLVIVLASAFVMANAIHSSVFQRKQEVEVLELIGATHRYIRWPYVIEGAFLGVLSCALALGVAYFLFLTAQIYFAKQAALLSLTGQLQFLSPATIVTFVFISGIVGALSSYLCVQKINSGWAASQGGF